MNGRVPGALQRPGVGGHGPGAVLDFSVAATDDSDGEKTSYEREREANIARNNSFLKDWGITEAVTNLTRAASNAGNKKLSLKKRSGTDKHPSGEGQSGEAATDGGLRRSQRAATNDNASQKTQELRLAEEPASTTGRAGPTQLLPKNGDSTALDKLCVRAAQKGGGATEFNKRPRSGLQLISGNWGPESSHDSSDSDGGGAFGGSALTPERAWKGGVGHAQAHRYRGPRQHGQRPRSGMPVQLSGDSGWGADSTAWEEGGGGQEIQMEGTPTAPSTAQGTAGGTEPALSCIFDLLPPINW